MLVDQRGCDLACNVQIYEMCAPLKSASGTAQVAPPVIRWLTEPTSFWCALRPSVKTKTKKVLLFFIYSGKLVVFFS